MKTPRRVTRMGAQFAIYKFLQIGKSPASKKTLNQIQLISLFFLTRFHFFLQLFLSRKYFVEIFHPCTDQRQMARVGNNFEPTR